MGAYLCIASNKIPPSVSKRITLIVECESISLFIRIYLCTLNIVQLTLCITNRKASDIVKCAIL